ncbi:MAG: hypothetical protein IPM37_10130 [Hahellaceae bacterium]|nr:hypothetical protein [Hahellaceae bacterium]
MSIEKTEAIALFKLMNIAERDIRSGKTMSLQEAKLALKEKRAKGKANLG